MNYLLILIEVRTLDKEAKENARVTLKALEKNANTIRSKIVVDLEICVNHILNTDESLDNDQEDRFVSAMNNFFTIFAALRETVKKNKTEIDLFAVNPPGFGE